MCMCSWLQERQMIMKAGDWERTYGKHHYTLTLAWIVFLWHYILKMYHGKQILTTKAMQSVSLLPKSTDHTHSSHSLPLNMISLSHCVSDHVFQCDFQISLGSILNIVSLEINWGSRIFHWFHWQIAKKIWELQLTNRTVFHSIFFLPSSPLAFFSLKLAKPCLWKLLLSGLMRWNTTSSFQINLWYSFSSTSARYRVIEVNKNHVF